MGHWGESKVNQGHHQGAAKKKNPDLDPGAPRRKPPQLGPMGGAAKNPPTWVQGWSAKNSPTRWKGRLRVKVSAHVVEDDGGFRVKIDLHRFKGLGLK